MKKILILCLGLFLLTGCDKKEDIIEEPVLNKEAGIQLLNEVDTMINTEYTTSEEEFQNMLLTPYTVAEIREVIVKDDLLTQTELQDNYDTYLFQVDYSFLGSIISPVIEEYKEVLEACETFEFDSYCQVTLNENESSESTYNFKVYYEEEVLVIESYSQKEYTDSYGLTIGEDNKEILKYQVINDLLKVEYYYEFEFTFSGTDTTEVNKGMYSYYQDTHIEYYTNANDLEISYYKNDIENDLYLDYKLAETVIADTPEDNKTVESITYFDQDHTLSLNKTNGVIDIVWYKLDGLGVIEVFYEPGVLSSTYIQYDLLSLNGWDELHISESSTVVGGNDYMFYSDGEALEHNLSAGLKFYKSEAMYSYVLTTFIDEAVTSDYLAQAAAPLTSERTYEDYLNQVNFFTNDFNAVLSVNNIKSDKDATINTLNDYLLIDFDTEQTN